jgi:NitT/TauT family transport system substrate-binding protein
VATLHWINTHSAADIANALPADFVQNNTISQDQYMAGLTTDKAQFLPDGIMPAGGPEGHLRHGGGRTASTRRS